MRENYINSNKIKENKYKILRMSLILGSDENREETITNFEESAREIDAMNDEIYLKDLENKFYDTLKLEEEEKKLAVLVDYIGGRVEQRISLLSDFSQITGYDLSNLPPIKYYDKLDDYKERLKYIREYLNNTNQITKLNEEIIEAEAKLKESYINKQTSEEYNGRNEEIILSKFKNIIRPLEYLKDVTKENIEEKISNIIINVEESKKSLDIFSKSYKTLKGSGISLEEELEYKSYVDNAKEIYYTNKEQEFLLKIYNLLFTKEYEYDQIILKREAINEIIYERLDLRRELEIEEKDILTPIYDLFESQYKDIEQQKNNIELINYLNNLIETKKEEKTELDQENQKVEILSLLREFCLIDTYIGATEPEVTEYEQEPITNNINIFDTPKEVQIEEEKELEQEELIIPDNLFMPNTDLFQQKEEIKEEEIIKDNQIISVESATTLDLDLIHSKASKVMQRVGEMLGIKSVEDKIVNVTNEKEEEKEEHIEEEIKEEKEEITEPLPVENPLFVNEINELTNEEPVDPEDNSNFWFPSDLPDALNDLPDLEVSNDNFFGDSNISDLSFPDLKLDFGPNDMEEK